MSALTYSHWMPVAEAYRKLNQLQKSAPCRGAPKTEHARSERPTVATKPNEPVPVPAQERSAGWGQR